ncbi:ribbon-helix-helix protein, CopG family [Leptospira interrogans serovar Bataviae str. HAI135]|nr:ribbon-helix-helix protein, CopG family [Leptospira interrogans serovar Bataviae str. HAI135]
MNQTVNISFEKALLKEIDKIAKREHRSRSELIREAARAYIEKKLNGKLSLISLQKLLIEALFPKRTFLMKLNPSETKETLLNVESIIRYEYLHFRYSF